MAKLYRRVEVVDGESTEPVHFVGIRVIHWLEGDCNIMPTAGFVEIETDIITDLLDACKAALDAIRGHDIVIETRAGQEVYELLYEEIAKAEGK